MQVLLTFDVEVWCDSWDRLDESFGRSFERYVYGRSPSGSYALPKTLEILNRYDLKGIFFVEPLFAARFGIEHLATIVSLIAEAGQEIQLHLHPEWTDEITPPPFEGISGKRQHLNFYSRAEQAALIRLGLRLLETAGAPGSTAFRAGSFAANADTFAALEDNKINVDMSIDAVLSQSMPEISERSQLVAPRFFGDVRSYPLSLFRDGFGRLRHAQVGACSAAELLEAMEGAAEAGWTEFVILSHNFEMLKPGTNSPDRIVAERFRRLCEYLSESRDTLPTAGIANLPLGDFDAERLPVSVSRIPTARRYLEQALRRIV